MRLRLIHAEPLPSSGLRAGFLVCASFLFAMVFGELILRVSLRPDARFLVAVGSLIALGLLLGAKLYRSPRLRPFGRSVALAFLAVGTWLLLTWQMNESIGVLRTVGLLACVLLVMVSVFRASVFWYAALAALNFLGLWLFVQDPRLSIQWTGGLVAMLLAMHLMTQRFLLIERARGAVAPNGWKLEQGILLSAKSVRAGFLACCCLLLTMAIGELVLYEHVAASPDLMMKLAGFALLGVCFSMTLFPQARSKLFWQGLATAGTACVAWLLWTYYLGASIGIGRTIILAICIVFVMIVIFRAPGTWYALATMIVVITFAVSTRSVLTSMAMAVAVAMLLIVMNYGVQLVLDHEREARLLSLRDAPSLQIAGKSAFVLLLPILGLVVLGMVVNYYLQRWLIQAPYTDGSWLGGTVAVVHSGCREGPKGLAELERDLHCSIDHWEAGVRREADTYVNGTSGDLKRLSGKAPEVVAREVMALRPATINGEEACKSFQKDFRIFRGSINVSFTSPCKGMIEHVNRALTETHTKMASAINNAVTAAGADVDTVLTTHTDAFRQEVGKEIHESAEQARETNRKLFIALRILQVISWMVLAISLLAAYQMLVGRVVFDRKTPKSLSFRLAKPHKLVVPLEATLHHMLNLAADLPKITTRENNATRWFVGLGMSRKGLGTSMNSVFFYPGTSPVQRMFVGNYVTTAIDVVPRSGGQFASTTNGSDSEPLSKPVPELEDPALSVAGDHRLVRIELQPGQQVGFRLADLVAWTEQIVMKSRYTTHIGASLLKLGSFCTVAEGAEWDERVKGSGQSGYIVLRSEGVMVSKSQIGTSTPVSNLLAWDDSQEFALDQRLHPLKVWINEPSVVTQSTAGAVLLDEGSPGNWPLIARIGNLFRYFLLPI